MEAIQYHAELQALEISDPVLQPFHPYRSQENRLAEGASTCPAPKYSHTPKYAPQIGAICSPTSVIHCHRKHLHHHSLILGGERCLCLQKQRRKSQTPATTEQTGKARACCRKEQITRETPHASPPAALPAHVASLEASVANLAVTKLLQIEEGVVGSLFRYLISYRV